MPNNVSAMASLRNLPSVEELSRSLTGRMVADKAGQRHAVALSRQVIAEIRQMLILNPTGRSKTDLLNESETLLGRKWESESNAGSQRVINATGVLIHTNLGRAPLAKSARDALQNGVSGYCNLEYDLRQGKRGKRAPKSEALITELTGAEAALVVNNCAAAAYFVLTVFASGSRVAISRGEMVEIGGDFRVPDVLSASGAILDEVGTTNRTRLSDYENSIDNGAGLILRVHPSNYRIVGFTESPTLEQLSDLGRRRGVLLYEDLGSGALIDLSDLGLKGEPTVRASVSAGVDIITFSGDKLLGGPQAGIILGRRELIDKLRKHPLYRVLRTDKLTNAALEATLEEYRRGSVTAVPVIGMLSQSKETILERVKAFLSRLDSPDLDMITVDGASAVGGGAAPGSELPTVLIGLRHRIYSASAIENSLRNHKPPVIARIEDDLVLLDLRTVTADEEEIIIAAISSISTRIGGQNHP